LAVLRWLQSTKINTPSSSYQFASTALVATMSAIES
jgi:hypothetical protein